MYGGRWHAVPDQEMDVNTVMRNHIEFDPGQDILEVALIYRIQRRHIESDKLIQDESKSMQLLVALRIEHAKELYIHALLVEHDSKLDEDKLRQLYQKYWH
jgi:hypothetical protein